MKKSRYTDTQIINILKQNQAGESVANLCREHGMSQATFQREACHCGANGALNMEMPISMLSKD